MRRNLPAIQSRQPELLLPQSRPWRSIFVFAPMLLAGIVSQAPNALGDTIIFHDLTDTVAVEHIGTQDILNISCPTTEGLGVPCLVTLTRPGASTTFGVGKINIAEDSTLQFASDQFRGSQNATSFDLSFVSLADGPDLSCTAAFGGPCGFFETGAVQTLGTFGWSQGTGDVIQFQSDIDVAVPEPATALLLATGAALLPYARQRRRRVAGSGRMRIS